MLKRDVMYYFTPTTTNDVRTPVGLRTIGPSRVFYLPNLNNNWLTAVIGQSHVTGWATLSLVGGSILWNSMTSTSFVFTELANTMKYGGGFLYKLVFTEWRHSVKKKLYNTPSPILHSVKRSDVTRFGQLRAIRPHAAARSPCGEGFTWGICRFLRHVHDLPTSLRTV